MPMGRATRGPQDFKTEYEKTALVVAARSKPKKGDKKKASAGAVANKCVGKLPIITDIDQKDARNFVPVGGHIWRDRQNGAWCSHFEPFRRFSASFRCYGQAEALRLNYVDLWGKWCLVNGVRRSECPMKGVFLPGELQESAPSSNAASSSRAT